ncbi:hypothetical protein NFI96_001085 [Prochilodus magdalenae]|nr:hypothetical protein NFI96_001085 [Prochilodus magdalenae]
MTQDARRIMANSNGNPELQGPAHTAQPSLSKEHAEDPTPAASQTPASGEKSQNKSKRKRRESSGPRSRKTAGPGSRDGRPDEVAGADNEQGPLPPLWRIPLKSLVEVETKLVCGDEQNITHRLARSPASTSSQLMCQSSETLGPPSGPNLGFLPQIDKRLDAALQDADAHYRLEKYAVAATCFAAALELCSKGTVLGKPFSADYEDISKVASFIESKLVACYLRMKRPDLALTHSHRRRGRRWRKEGEGGKQGEKEKERKEKKEKNKMEEEKEKRKNKKNEKGKQEKQKEKKK